MVYAESVSNMMAWTGLPTPGVDLGLSLGNWWYPAGCATGYDQDQEPYYGTLSNATSYFKTRLHTQAWDFADKEERQSALHMATRCIEVLNFKGHKAIPGQLLFFPRTIDVPGYHQCNCLFGFNYDKTIVNFTRGFGLAVLGYPPICPDHPPPKTGQVVPGQIEVACFEIALCFLNGFDPEIEARNLQVTSQGYAGARTSYNRDYIPEHLRAGIPSAYAWSLLKPFLADVQQVRITRGA